MDQRILVENQITDGLKLIDRLVENGVAVMAACWLQESDGDLWYLYLVTPLVSEDEGTTPVYRRITAVIRAISEPLWIDPFQIKVVGPWERVGQAILELQGRHASRLPTRYGEANLGGLSVEAAYIYPPTAPTPAR